MSEGPKVVPLFEHTATAAGLPVQPDVIDVLETLLEEARSGRMAGIIYIGLDSQGNYMNGTRGKIVYTAAVTSLEELKLSIISSNAHMLLADK